MPIILRNNRLILPNNKVIIKPLNKKTIDYLNATGITDTTQISAINYFFDGIDQYNLTSKLFAAYLFIGGTASLHKWNAMNPVDSDAAYRLTFYGGITYDSNGIKGDGISGYADTHINNAIISQDSFAFGFYSMTNNTFDSIDMGSTIVTNFLYSVLTSVDSGDFTPFQALGSINNTSAYCINHNFGNSSGMFLVSRTSSTNVAMYRNGILGIAASKPSTAPSAVIFYLLARNANTTAANYSNRGHGFTFFGTGLTDIDAANLSSIVNGYQTILGRNVY